MTITEAHLLNDTATQAWQAQIAPVLELLSENGCLYKSITIQGNAVRIELQRGHGDTSNFYPAKRLTHKEADYMRHELLGVFIDWPVAAEEPAHAA